jgi:hypothetical protein
MIICNSREYIFIHLHKTGGSSFEIAAEPTLAWNDLLLGSTEIGETLNKYYMNRFGLNKHSSLSEILESCATTDIKDYRYLSIVRHPIKRAISLYRFIGTLIEDFCKSQNVSLEKVNEQYEFLKAQYWPLCWPASEAYVKTMGDVESFFIHNALERESAMKPQFTQISIDNYLPSQLQIVKLEEINQSNKIFKDFTGTELKIPHENKSSTRSVSIADLPSQTKDYLYSRFKPDLMNFDYQ